MRDKLFIPEHKTNNIVLRFIANHIFHSASMFFFNIALKYNDKIEWDIDYRWHNRFVEYFGFKIYHILDKPYSKWGTVYKMDLSSLNIDELGGKGWNDYDENGIPYWDYFWHNDEETGDGWRLVLNEDKS